MEHTEILEIVYRGKSCVYLSKGLKENVTETLESEQTFVYAVTDCGQDRGWEWGCVCKMVTKDKEMKGKA